jgi:starch synthase
MEAKSDGNEIMKTGLRVALFVWGDLIEDFLDSIGLTLEDYTQNLSGGWLFGYVASLKLADIDTVIFCVSARVDRVSYVTNEKTGVTFCLLPATQIYRRIRSRLHNPYAWTVEGAYDKVRAVERPVLKFIKACAPYLATPLRTFVRELQVQKCSAVICQDYEYPRFDICVLLGKIFHFPVFACFQGGDFQISFLETLFRHFAMRGCSGLIIGARSEVERVLSRYRIAPSKIAVIFNPVDLFIWFPVERAEARKKYGIPLDAKVIINYGRTEIERKGLDVLLRAWSMITTDRQDCKLNLLLIGTGNDAQTLSNTINEMRLRGIIRINEYVLDRTMIREYLSCADVYVMSSRHEGFPVTPLEAMACALPVVVTRVQGIPEIVQNEEHSGGFIVPIGDPEALATAIGNLLDDPARARRMGEAARRRIEEAFSLEAVGKQLRGFIFPSEQVNTAVRTL